MLNNRYNKAHRISKAKVDGGKLLIEIVRKSKTLTSELSQTEIDEFSSKEVKKIFIKKYNTYSEYYGTIKLDNEKNFNYYIFYVIHDPNRGYCGIKLQLNPQMPERNKLVELFHLRINDFRVKKNLNKMSVVDFGKSFNIYQNQQKYFFISAGYQVFGEEISPDLLNWEEQSYKDDGYSALIFLPTYSASLELTKKSNENFIYIMHNRKNGYYKIGRSNKPMYRERTLQAEDPEIFIVKKWLANKSIEKSLHKKFRNKRVRGEWFKLDINDIEEIEVFMSKLNKITEP